MSVYRYQVREGGGKKKAFRGDTKQELQKKNGGMKNKQQGGVILDQGARNIPLEVIWD